MNIEDDVMWNQAVQIIEKTVIIMQTVSDTLKMFSYSVSIVLIAYTMGFLKIIVF